jgi:RNA polymerase sigma-70 factor (ECF subfamily)
MPAVRRKVFELSRIEGLSYKEIATELSLSIKTVEHHIALALKQLRHFMGLLPVLIVYYFS